MSKTKIKIKQWYYFDTYEDKEKFIREAMKQYEGIDRFLGRFPECRNAQCLRVNDDVYYNYRFNFRTTYNEKYMPDCILYKYYNKKETEQMEDKTAKTNLKEYVDSAYNVIQNDYVVDKQLDDITKNYYIEKREEYKKEAIDKRKQLLENTECYKIVEKYKKAMHDRGYDVKEDLTNLCEYEIVDELDKVKEDYVSKMAKLKRKCSECSSLIYSCTTLEERLTVYEKFGIKIGE